MCPGGPSRRNLALLGLGVTVCILGLAGAVVWSRFTTALEVERARVSRGSRVMTSARFGQIEYAMEGQGAPVLVVHGAGGGFDQPPTARLVAAGYQVIVPSRFGYLRSSIPSDPTPESQADAFAALLDELGIRSVFVVGISAGALSALQFALRHPDRCRSLVLIVPAASAAGLRSSAQGPMPRQGFLGRAIAGRLVRSDFLYWLGLTLAHDWMMRSVLATDPAVVAAASPAERERADTILRQLLPISARSEGLLNDVRLVSTRQRIALEHITAPTLVFSLEDDRYRTIEPARIIAATIPGARLVTYPTGGHVWVGHDAELFAEADGFLRQHEQP